MTDPSTPKGPGAYKVGKGKPPKHTQWKPGQCGNPNKIKKAKPPQSAAEEFAELCDKVVSVTQGGTAVKMSRRTALLMKVLNAALSGDHRSQKLSLSMLAAAEASRPAGQAAEVSEEDYRELLAILKEEAECQEDG